MDTPPRRCYSDYGASSSSNTLSLVPSHVATKIREAQLRQTNANELLTAKHKHAFPFRDLTGFSLRLPKILPSWRTTQTPAKKQVDGAENFPSIAAILAEPSQDCDLNQVMAETEFYENTDHDGIVRRRSIMRTVDKDDYLRGRGANPRTGMITPDVHSVADSLDSVTAPQDKIKLPSAQWRLKDNQWVSEMQDEEKEAYLPGDVPEIPSQPLTSNNLRTFSNSLLGGSKAQRLQSPSTEAMLSVGKIRRKPVNSTSKNSDSDQGISIIRSVSEDTVVRTPPVERSDLTNGNGYSFFSPEDVGRAQGYIPREIEHQRLPFLGQLAKPALVPQNRGFARDKKKLAQLESCLRTSDGPYPSPPSGSQDKQFTNRRILHGSKPWRDDRVRMEHPRAFLPAAPRAYLSDLAVEDPHQRNRLQSDQVEGRQNRGLMKQQRSMTLNQCNTQDRLVPCNSFEAARLTPRAQQNVTSIEPRLMCRESDSIIIQTHAGGSSSRHVITPKGDSDIPNDSRPCATSKDVSGSAHPTRTITSRPPLGPRHNATKSPTTVKSMKTHTVLESPSSSTGTNSTIDGDGTERDGVESVDILLYPSANSMPIARLSKRATRTDRPDFDFEDHSACCPRCCVEHDCHEGCLGHSPQGEADTSETSSLMSMGVFDVSFETSVKAVNEVLLTPHDKRGSALTKLRRTFVESLWQPVSRTPVKQPPLKRTLRQPSPVRGEPIKDDPTRKPQGSRIMDTKQARTAAALAMSSKGAIKQRPQGPRSAKGRDKANTSKADVRDIESAPIKHEANKGRKVSSVAPVVLDDVVSEVEVNFDEVKSTIQEVVESDCDTESVIAKIGALVRVNDIAKPLVTCRPVLLKYGPILFERSKDMVVVILDTMTVLSCMICDYQRTGNVVIPDGVSMAELMGNCLRSLMYLMIAACLYALLVKVSHVILCVLRIVLLPVRLCAWVVG